MVDTTTRQRLLDKLAKLTRLIKKSPADLDRLSEFDRAALKRDADQLMRAIARVLLELDAA